MNSQSFTKIIGGNGPKMVDLEQMREVHLLQDRVELLGSIPPGQVGDVSLSGQESRFGCAKL